MERERQCFLLYSVLWTNPAAAHSASVPERTGTCVEYLFIGVNILLAVYIFLKMKSIIFHHFNCRIWKVWRTLRQVILTKRYTQWFPSVASMILWVSSRKADLSCFRNVSHVWDREPFKQNYFWALLIHRWQIYAVGWCWRSQPCGPKLLT